MENDEPIRIADAEVPPALAVGDRVEPPEASLRTRLRRHGRKWEGTIVGICGVPERVRILWDHTKNPQMIWAGHLQRVGGAARSGPAEREE